MTDLKAAVFTVLEGWALPLDARKILETAYYAQPEQAMTPISPDQYERLCFTCGACTGKPWVGLTGLELNHIYAANVGYPERMCRAIEAKLKEKNT